MSALEDDAVSAIDAELAAQGMHQRGLADLAGVSEKHVSGMLNGHKAISLAMLDRLGAALDVQFAIVIRRRRG